MHFGKKLLAARYEPWAVHYLDYDRLKSLLEDRPPPLATAPIEEDSFHWSVHGEEGSEFLRLLNREVEKIFLFFLAEQGRLASELSQLQHEMRIQREDSLFSNPSSGKMETLSLSVKELSLHLLRLIQYVELNVSGVRKILKKNDKHSQSKLTAMYLGRKGPLLQPLLTNESLDGLIRVCNATMEMWRDLQHEQRYAYVPQATSETPEGITNGAAVDVPHSHGLVSPLASSPRKDYGSPLFQLSKHQLNDMPAEHVLVQIKEARKKLKQTNEFVQVLAAPMMVEERDEDVVSFHEDEDARKIPSSFSNFLNLMSTFLYMTNYYIVAPASNTYAEKLGSDPSIAGMIIGATPIAALVSTLLYSWWTSYSYKSALVFASTCSGLGNILYAAGLPCQSLTLVMAGRLLNGFGSARSINRRYIADTFSREDRTAASAAFVTAGALGMAAGPLMASLLNYSVTKGDDNLLWQVENAPGWFMFVVWMVYLVCLIFYFTDPPKRHYLPPPPPAHTTGEKQALLASDSGELDTLAQPSFCENVPTFVTFTVYFVLKLALESILSSSAILTLFYFHWSGQVTGFFLACLGLLMLPANLVVAFLSRRYDDRELIRGLVILMLVGCVGVLSYSETYTVAQYLIASVVIFVSTNALEGPNMSLLSKAIPLSWSKGFFNVGLLATEAGTAGRAVGDVLLTVCGSRGEEYLLNSIFTIMSALSFSSLVLVVRFWHRLVPRDDKDD